ncbi:MAG: hypothetical protein LBG66_01000 [Gallionellaceae bacterium]|jgi:hypothetical protein|nr:hypothetical protein [Gallionellaceae bacterium]
MTSDDDTETDWPPLSMVEIVALSLLAAWIVWQHFLGGQGWVFLLDNATLALHEAGHPVIGMLSNRLMVYGGTIFQLLFPIMFAVYFRRQRMADGWAASLIWLAASLMNVGEYMRDARDRVLPLTNPNEDAHDWAEIFGRWGLLAQDVHIGNSVKALGLGLLLYAVWWMWRHRR